MSTKSIEPIEPIESIESDSRFPRCARLLRASDFERALRKPEIRIRRGALRLVAVANERQLARLGLIVGKRAVAKAHERNRIKRIIRDRFRTAMCRLAGYDLVIRVTNPLRPQELHTALEGLFDELEERSVEHSQNS